VKPSDASIGKLVHGDACASLPRWMDGLMALSSQALGLFLEVLPGLASKSPSFWEAQNRKRSEQLADPLRRA
jgi:hypothetical protein